MDDRGLSQALARAVHEGRPLTIEQMRISGGPEVPSIKIEGLIMGSDVWVRLDCVRAIAFDPITCNSDMTARLDVYVQLVDLRCDQVLAPVSVTRLVLWRLRLRAGLVRVHMLTEIGRLTGTLVGGGRSAGAWARAQWERLVSACRPVTRSQAAEAIESRILHGPHARPHHFVHLGEDDLEAGHAASKGWRCRWCGVAGYTMGECPSAPERPGG